MLSRDVLKQGLSPLFDSRTMPRGGVPDAISFFLRGYVPYAQQATALGTLPSPLIAEPQDGDYLTALDSSLRAMWMAVAWAGPGLVGTTAVVPPIQPFLTAIAPVIIGVTDADRSLSLIVEAVHTYTLSITVAVTPPSGTPAIVPLA